MLTILHLVSFSAYVVGREAANATNPILNAPAIASKEPMKPSSTTVEGPGQVDFQEYFTTSVTDICCYCARSEQNGNTTCIA